MYLNHILQDHETFVNITITLELCLLNLDKHKGIDINSINDCKQSV